MHRSRIGLFLIDHPPSSFDAALAFWGGVQGLPPKPQPDSPYAGLGQVGSLSLEAQRIGHGDIPRVHIDIETDDVPAEVARVVGLGATVVEEREGYAILADPGGLVFCVVPVQTGADFDEHAVSWE